MSKAKKPMENLKFRCKLQQADYIRINGTHGTRTPSGKSGTGVERVLYS